MTKSRATTIPGYIDAASDAAKPYLNRLYEILQGIAPDAQQTIKWGNPFFVEPRFLFSFTAHKAHFGFMTSNEALDSVRHELKDYDITPMGLLKVPYAKAFPEAAIKKLAQKNMDLVLARDDDHFWPQS